MKVVTCIGYHGTGSGAVADYLKEFKTINDPCNLKGEFEFRLLYDPDGIRDLEYHLVSERLRGNSSAAIKRFIKYAKILDKDYSKRFNIDFYKISQDYISSIAKFSYYGWSLPDFYTFSSFKRKKIYFKKLMVYLFNRKKWKDRSNINPYKKELSYHSNISKNDFDLATKEYLNHIFENSFDDNKINLLEQMTPTNNISEYIEYFDDLKVFVVDRDPRDCYIQYMLKHEHIYSTNVDEFCEMYKDYRDISSKENNNICKIDFEDMIYNYESTTKKIREFIGISENEKINTRIFKPEVSKKNTKLFLKHPEFSSDIKIIEEKLSDYLYEFPLE